jgi:hypothetical protein
MKLSPLFALFVVLPFLWSASARSQDTIIEPSTEKAFPRTVTFTHDGAAYSLSATGTTVRKKLFIKVYAVVHYLEGTLQGSPEARLQEVLQDGPAKQLTLDFARDVGQTQIQDAFRDGFTANATDDEFASIEPKVQRFLSFFDREITENSQLTFRWLPGGVVLTEAYGEWKEPLTDPTFARVLWTIWFGEDSIVDPEELVSIPAAK